MDMEASYPDAVIEVWTAMAVAWEADSGKPNPFASTLKYTANLVGAPPELRTSILGLMGSDILRELPGIPKNAIVRLFHDPTLRRRFWLKICKTSQVQGPSQGSSQYACKLVQEGRTGL